MNLKKFPLFASNLKNKNTNRINKSTRQQHPATEVLDQMGPTQRTMTHNDGSKFDSAPSSSFSRAQEEAKSCISFDWKGGANGTNLRQSSTSSSHNPTDDDRVSFKGDPADPALWSSTVGRLRYVLVRKLFNILVQSCVVIFHAHDHKKKKKKKKKNRRKTQKCLDNTKVFLSSLLYWMMGESVSWWMPTINTDVSCDRSSIKQAQAIRWSIFKEPINDGADNQVVPVHFISVSHHLCVILPSFLFPHTHTHTHNTKRENKSIPKGSK